MPHPVHAAFRLAAVSLVGIFAASCQVGTGEASRNPGAATAEVYTGPVIDMHLHAYDENSGRMLFDVDAPPTLRGQVFEGVDSPVEQREATLDRLRANNVVKAVVTNGEAWAREAPDLVLLARGQSPLEELREDFETGRLTVMAELSPFYQGLRADDPSLDPYFALAAELGVPVGVHILPGGPNGGRYLMPQMLGGMRIRNADPGQLDEVLVRHPELKLYVMHGGWPFIEKMKALLYAHPQVYLDISVINWLLPEAELHAYLEELVDAGFGDRIMYGSDQMVWPDVIDVGIASVNSAPLTLEQKGAIFYDNAATFLGLGAEEIAVHRKAR